MMILVSKVGLIIGKLNIAWFFFLVGICIVRLMMFFFGILYFYVEFFVDMLYF